jgi:ABC-type antimicrobial peptide transport system ATPase subunit
MYIGHFLLSFIPNFSFWIPRHQLNNHVTKTLLSRDIVVSTCRSCAHTSLGDRCAFKFHICLIKPDKCEVRKYFVTC